MYEPAEETHTRSILKSAIAGHKLISNQLFLDSDKDPIG